MASYLQSTNRRPSGSNGLRDLKAISTKEQKAAHVELLLRKLYAKVDELETVCKEEKDFYTLLKRRGKKSVPKFDANLLPRVVASQQRCAENAFNNLDIFKRNHRLSVRKVPSSPNSKGVNVENKSSNVANENRAEKTSDNNWTWNRASATSIKEKATEPVPPPIVENTAATPKDNSWYGSLDRNVKRKKRAFLDRSRRHTKTVGSLAGLDVENIDMLQPDEQYTFGLPAVDTKFDLDVAAIKPALPPGVPSHRIVPNVYLHTTGVRPHDRRDVSWPQLPPSHSYTRSQPAPLIHPIAPEHDSPRWFETSVDTVDASIVVTADVLLPNYNESVGATDVNFNRLTISSPTEASERSSRSSENGDAKASFLNESSKPFEMSDYYKYSTKYRSQKREKIASSKKSDSTNIPRVNGTSNLREEVPLVRPSVNEISTGPSYPLQREVMVDPPEDTEPKPKLPPKLRPILNGSSISTSALTLTEKPDRSCDIINGNPRDGNQEAWVQTTPTIV